MRIKIDRVHGQCKANEFINYEDANKFLDAAFKGYDPDKEYIGISQRCGNIKCARTVIPHLDPFWQENSDRAWYTLVSTVKKSSYRRRKVDMSRLFMLGRDDVGTKSKELPDLPSHCRLVSSMPDGKLNCWEYYFIEPVECTPEFAESFNNIIRSMGADGLTDGGAGGVQRLCRIPTSLHSSGFRAEIDTWDLNRPRWKFPDLVNALGVDLAKAKKIRNRIERPPVSLEQAWDDPFVKRLADMGFEPRMDGDDCKVPFECWFDHDSGTSSSTDAVYYPASGVFHCSHGTCQRNGTRAMQERFYSWFAKHRGLDLR